MSEGMWCKNLIEAKQKRVGLMSVQKIPRESYKVMTDSSGLLKTWFQTSKSCSSLLVTWLCVVCMTTSSHSWPFVVSCRHVWPCFMTFLLLVSGKKTAHSEQWLHLPLPDSFNDHHKKDCKIGSVIWVTSFTTITT